MEGRVLIVEANRLVRSAVASALTRQGYFVCSVASASATCQLPPQFDCGVFPDALPDSSPIALAAWLLIEERIASAVFFGASRNVELRLRASNLGTYVGHDDGLKRLTKAVRCAILEIEHSPHSKHKRTRFERTSAARHETRPRRVL